MTGGVESLDIHQILENLPHRYPFLLIDRVTEFVPGEYLTGYKNVSINEPFFQGHFPYRPVMPGVLILESLAQAAGIFAFKTAQVKPSADSVFYLVGIDDVRFKQPVEPGDQLLLHIKLVRSMRDVWKFETEARVEDTIVASAQIMCARRAI